MHRDDIIVAAILSNFRTKSYIEQDVVIDTGFAGGIMMPQSMATDLGLTLHPITLPMVLANGTKLPGKYARLSVMLVDPRVIGGHGPSAVVRAYCPNELDDCDVLLGMSFIRKVGSFLAIGSLEWELTEAVPNRRKISSDEARERRGDFSHWRMRPRGDAKKY